MCIGWLFVFFFFKQKTAYDMRISDWSSDVCSSDLESRHGGNGPTAFHQDFITFAVDRSGGMTFWFPLEAYGPESGTMSFVNGSHRLGVMEIGRASCRERVCQSV